MCDKNKLTTDFNSIKIANEQILSDYLYLSFGDVEVRENGFLLSSQVTEITITDLEFYTSGYKCVEENKIICNGAFFMKELKSGPYQTINLTVNFKRLYFWIHDLFLYTKVIFIFNPKTICTDQVELDSSGNPKAKGLTFMIIDPITGIEYDDFLVTDGLNREAENPTFMAIEYAFNKYSTNLGIFWKAILDSIMKNSTIVNKINQEFIRIYCEYDKLQKQKEEKRRRIEESLEIPAYVNNYNDKLEIIKRLFHK
jgi:hypothetical protein